MRGDEAVDAGAGKLDELADKAAAKGGVGGKIADELAEDAAFLRKLKPSLIVKRVKGELPKNAEPGRAGARTPKAPSGPSGSQLGPRKAGGRGPNPFVVAGAAFAAGTALAKLIDWRGHAHPRR
jgi:hypothetical protein